MTKMTIDPNQIIEQELREAQSVLNDFLSNPKYHQSIADAAHLMIQAIEHGNKIISCGNGGSHCDAMHFAEELTGRFRNNRRSLPAIAISDPAYISCVGNDYGFDHVFSRFVQGVGNKGDVLLAISTSGNSKNILNAVQEAQNKEMKVVLLSGKNGGDLADTTDVEIRVPHFGYADRIQEVHIKVIHIMILLIEKQLGLS